MPFLNKKNKSFNPCGWSEIKAKNIQILVFWTKYVEWNVSVTSGKQTNNLTIFSKFKLKFKTVCVFKAKVKQKSSKHE